MLRLLTTIADIIKLPITPPSEAMIPTIAFAIPLFSGTQHSLNIAKMFPIRKFMKNIPINPKINIIIKGEYDYTLRDIAFFIDNKKEIKDIKGITYRKNNKIHNNPERPYIENLDELPFPARHLLPMDMYKVLGKNAVPELFTPAVDVLFIVLFAQRLDCLEINSVQEVPKMCWMRLSR